MKILTVVDLLGQIQTYSHPIRFLQYLPASYSRLLQISYMQHLTVL